VNKSSAARDANFLRAILSQAGTLDVSRGVVAIFHCSATSEQQRKQHYRKKFHGAP
jgi:hypothetical protein